MLEFHANLHDTPGRANRAVSALRALMTYAEDVGLRPVHSNPARKIKLYRERGRERFLSEAEISKAAEAIAAVEREGKIGPHAAAGLRLALFTGARSGEITAAKWEYVDCARRIIRLPDSKTNEPRTPKKWKGNKKRAVSSDHEARSEIKSLVRKMGTKKQ